jgi:hypothetical protein
MRSKKLGIVAAVLAGLGTIGISLAFGQSPGVARRAPMQPRPGETHLSPEATMVYNFVKRQGPGQDKWRQIPWLVDLPKAIRQARAEDRPILLFVSGDDPLERC